MDSSDVILVTGKSVSDKCINTGFSNCPVEIKHPVTNKFSPVSLFCNINIASTGVMKKGMTAEWIIHPGMYVIAGAPLAGKSLLMTEFIKNMLCDNKKGGES